MTIAERLEQRGIIKGKEVGIQIGMEKGIERYRGRYKKSSNEYAS